jgi:hypothetical protein
MYDSSIKIFNPRRAGKTQKTDSSDTPSTISDFVDSSQNFMLFKHSPKTDNQQRLDQKKSALFTPLIQLA